MVAGRHTSVAPFELLAVFWFLELVERLLRRASCPPFALSYRKRCLASLLYSFDLNERLPCLNLSHMLNFKLKT
jgi:hypothetical protein